MESNLVVLQKLVDAVSQNNIVWLFFGQTVNLYVNESEKPPCENTF